MLKKRERLLVFIGCGVLMLLLAGCGGKENITQAMSKISELNYQEALELFAVAEEAGENEKLIARGRGIAYMGMTQYEEAEKYFLEALNCSNGIPEDMDYDINLYLAAVYAKQEKYTQAEEVYNAILALRPKDDDVKFMRGIARLKLDKYAEAKEDMDQVVAKAPKDFERVLQIYEAMEAAGHKDAGQGYLTDALQNYEDQMTEFIKGRMYYYMGDYQKAYVALELAKKDGGVDAYLYLGMAYESTGDYNYASSVYNSYLAKEGDDARVYNQLGLCEMKKGEYNNALTAFQSGLQMEENTMKQSLLFNEIAAYEYLGDFAQAKVLMNKYLAMYPDDVQAQREAGFLTTR
ncbi:MAG: tetratricopeptide repeat protein [Lachnospiraceae bacterium]|nr:tetratricopeptide repeat protein [Lachnospiraceae bacterium]